MINKEVSKSAAEAENTFGVMLNAELNEIRRRVEDLEDKKSDAVAISTLTPSDDLGDVKRTLNFLINYLNIGIRNQPGVRT